MKKIFCLCFSAVLVLMCVACANRTTVMVSDPAGQADVTTAGVSDPETTGGEALATTRSSASGKVSEAKPTTEKITGTTVSSSAPEKVTKATTTKKTTYIPPLPVQGDPLSLQPAEKIEVSCDVDIMSATARICRSVNDLDVLSDLSKSHFKESDVLSSVDKTRIPYVLKEKYNDAFFADKALLVLYFYERNGGITGSVESLSLDGSTLRANVALEKRESLTKNLYYTQAITQWLWVYELPADVAAVATDAAVQSHETVRYVD